MEVITIKNGAFSGGLLDVAIIFKVSFNITTVGRFFRACVLNKQTNVGEVVACMMVRALDSGLSKSGFRVAGVSVFCS